MIRNWRAPPPPFQCVVDATTSRHKINVKESQIQVFRDRSYIRFETLLQRLKEMETNDEITFATHSFRVVGRRNEKLTEIWNNNYCIEDGSRIIASRRSKRSIEMLLKLMDTVEAKLVGKPDSAPLKDSFWRTVSLSMERKDFKGYSPNRAFKEFRTLVVEYENYLDHRLSRPKGAKCSPIPVLFSRLETMRLKPFFFNARRYQNLEQKKTELAVKDTVDYLLIQTSMASSDVDHRMTLGGDQKEGKPEEKTVRNRRKSPKKSSRNDMTKYDKFRPSFESDIDDRFDSALIDVILDLQTKSQPYYDWPTIRRMMLNRGFHAYGERYCKKRFNWLISKWIWAMEHFPSVKKAAKEWPLFTLFMQLDLHPFVDHQTYKVITQMKANFGRNRGIKPTTFAPMIPFYNRTPNQKNWDKNYFNYYNYYHNLWSHMSRKYF